MREDDLPDAFGRFPPSAHDRMVLVQNGFLEAVLGPLGDVTRGLIWFTSKGDFFEILNPSPFYGPRAVELVPLLAEGGLAVETITSPTSVGFTSARSSASSAAGTATSLVASSGSATRRSRIPVRSKIHSSLVSTSWAMSSFVTTRWGTCAPTPTIPTGGSPLLTRAIKGRVPWEG